MYRIYLALAAFVLLGQASWAGPVSRKRASEVASRFVHLDTRAEALRSAELEHSGVEPAYHVFNDSDRSGFVIVSGQEGVTPILGYAEEGQVVAGQLPEQLVELLRRYELRIKELRRSTTAPLGQSQSILKHRPKVLIGPLLSCEWNQNSPYNNLAPIKRGEQRAPIGCVATAMAQVMYFHKWPTKGIGEHTYTSKHYGELSVDFEKSTYDWSSMIDRYRRSSSATPLWNAKAGEAVARLMYDAAVSVNMQFTPNESGAFTFDAAKALDKNFDYDVRYLSRELVNNEHFVSAVKEELASGNPILMTGASDAGGHAWVLDGYDENGFIHVNWGWGGMSNGYFELDFMDPPSLGIGGGGGKFNQGQDVIMLRPRKAGVAMPERLQGRFSLFDDEAGMSIDLQASDLADGSASFNIPAIGNYMQATFKGEFGVGLYSSDGTLLHAFPSYALGQVPRLSYFTSDQNVRIYLTAAQRDLVGRFYFAPISREQRLKTPTANPHMEDSWEVSGHWLPMWHSNRIEVELDKGAIKVLDDGNAPRFVLTAAPEVLAQVWMRRKGSVRAPIRNASFVSLKGQVALALESVGQASTLRDTLATDMTVFYDYTTVDRPLLVSTLTSRRLKAGKYKVNFCIIKPEEKYIDDAGQTQTDPRAVYPVENPFGAFELEILDPANRSMVEYYTSQSALHSLEFFHDGKIYEQDALSLNDAKQGRWEIGVSLKNTGVALQTPIRYRLKDMATGAILELGESSSLWLGTSIVTNGQTKAAIDFGAVRLEGGHTYRILVEVRSGNQWVDVWNANEPRRYLFVSQDEQVDKPSEGGGTSDPNTAALDKVEGAKPALYPNPASGLVYLEGAAVARVEIYDMQGRRLLVHQPTEGECTIDVSSLSSGVYVTKLMLSSGEVSIDRLMIL